SPVVLMVLTIRGRGAAAHLGAPAGRVARVSALALLPDPYPDDDRRAREGEVLTEAAFDEAAVAVLEEPAGEDDEPRRTGAGLGREQDAGLLAAAQGVRVRGDQLAEEGVEPPGGDPAVPRLQRRLDRRHQLLGVPAGLRGDVHARRPGHVREITLDLVFERPAALLVQQVPLVE